MTFDTIGFLERAVQTPSHDDVDEMRSLVREELSAHDIDSDIDEAGNTIASRGNGPPHVVLNTHLDTVSPFVPFDRDEDVIHGRGACDAKGPLAAFMSAFVEYDGSGRVTLALTPDEETDSFGAANLDLVADAFVVGEPTGLDVCNAARGRFEVIVELSGENAHAAEPGAGVNAVAAVEDVLSAARSFDRECGPATHQSLGDPSLTPTVVQGGDAANQVPDQCRIVFDRRSVPPESSEEFREQFATYLRGRVDQQVGVSVSFTDREAPFLGAFDTSADASIVEAFIAGGAGSIRPFGAATEAAIFAEVSPTIVFGPGVLADEDGGVAHADREYVGESEVMEAAGIARRGLDRFMQMN